MLPFLAIFLFFFNINLAEQERKCDAFDCKTISHPNCGVLPIDCTSKTPTLVDQTRSYQVKNLWQNGTCLIHDPYLQRQLDSRICNANFSVPRSPFFVFQLVSSSVTFLRCRKKDRSDNAILRGLRFYEDCKDDYVLHSSYPEKLNLSWFYENKLIPLCSIVELPSLVNTTSASKDNYPFSLFTADFHWRWKLSDMCLDCSKVGHCRTDNISGPYECVIGGVIDASAPNTRRKIKIGVGAAAAASLLTILAAILLFRRWRENDLRKNSTLISRGISPDHSMRADPEKGSSYFNTPIFTYKELEEATNNFDSSNELGDGGFGTVYYGVLKDGRAVAVKRLYENNSKRVEQFMNEVGILSLLRHTNLVSLYGCTSRHSRGLLLVYEYVSNGTVADHLHGEHSSAGLVTWPIRLSIAIESAGALVYLHASDIVHRDVKTNNILLDKSFHVKVADFGLSRLCPTDATHVSTAPQGTPGYVDPEYYQCYQLTDKSDVYSFGVVLIELISSKPAVDTNRHRHEINLSNMAVNKIRKDALHELVDVSLGFDSSASIRRAMTLVAELAVRCLQQVSDARPSMSEVLEVLKGIEAEYSKVVKPGEMDIPAKDVRLLKNNPPVSPNSVANKWASISSTTYTSC